MRNYDVTVIGGGPAGLAAALSADRAGAKTLLIEREARLGGVLKQCIHDGFGVLRFHEKLSGCEYATRFVHEVERSSAEISLLTFATELEKTADGFSMTLIRRSGLERIATKTIVLATGCRERTAKQIGVHGSRGAGVFTAGSAQYYINVMGELPGKRCVILGSGDIGLIMARRLTLEGTKVEGVYEAKPTPSGLTRNIVQCLHDFEIPLHLSHTVTEVHGEGRITGVTVAEVDGAMHPIPGTEREVACDTLILSVGLIPENELAEALEVPLDPHTHGPVCDECLMTMQPGVFSCGNALNVFDLADYVSQSGERAGAAAAAYAAGAAQQRSVSSGIRCAAPPAPSGAAAAPRHLVTLASGDSFLCAIPQRIDADRAQGETTFFFRSKDEHGKARVRLSIGSRTVWEKTYRSLRPPEMERFTADFSGVRLDPAIPLTLSMEDMV